MASLKNSFSLFIQLFFFIKVLFFCIIIVTTNLKFDFAPPPLF